MRSRSPSVAGMAGMGGGLAGLAGAAVRSPRSARARRSRRQADSADRDEEDREEEEQRGADGELHIGSGLLAAALLGSFCLLVVLLDEIAQAQIRTSTLCCRAYWRFVLNALT